MEQAFSTTREGNNRWRSGRQHTPDIKRASCCGGPRTLLAIRAEPQQQFELERTLEREGYDYGPEPLSKTRFVEGPAGDLEHDRDDLRLGSLNLEAIHEKEHVHGHKADAFVPVQEWLDRMGSARRMLGRRIK
jgi:hypothetical protein